MRSFWSRIPLLRLAIPVITGVGLQLIVARQLSSSPLTLFPAAFLFLSSLLAVLVIGRIKNVTLAYRVRTVNGIAIIVSVISFTFLLTWFYTQKNYPGHFARFLSDKNVLAVQVTDPPVLHNKTITVYAEVEEVNNNDGHFTTTGNIQLDFLRDSVCETLAYGDELLITSKVDTTQRPQNPYEFNYKTYQSYHNIYHRAFVTSKDWALIARNRGNSILSAIYKLRNNFLSVIARYVKDKNDFGVATAIMLGYRDYINADIMRAYASSGAVHVLSVSGLHVSVMFFMLNFLLTWMNKRGQKLLVFKAALIISFMWFYACLTGLSPPVLRSAMMFTLFQLGYVFTKNANSYNIVSGSAVLLLLWNPFIITDVGFQLSYLAVFGLIYLQPKIANLIAIPIPQHPNFKQHTNWTRRLLTLVRSDSKWFTFKLLDFCWQLIAASLAAQIATLPLCLFYFYQFPNLFLLSNMVVIPLGNLLLFAGTALFAVAHIPYLNYVTGWLFNTILVALNKFIFWIDSLSFALTKGLCISVTEVILLYLLIFLFCWLTEERKNKIAISALAVILVLCTLSSFKKFEHTAQKEVVVYAVPKQKAVAFISGKTSYYDIDSALYNNQSNMQFNIYPHWWQSGITRQIPVTGSSTESGSPIYSRQIRQGRLILFEGKKILLIDSLTAFSYYGTKIKLKPDLVILSGNIKASIPILKKSIDFDEVVFDSSCKPSARKRWKKDCSNLNINYYDVNTDGAFIWDLRQTSQ